MVWIISTLGAFSVVKAAPEPGRSGKRTKLMIRARVRRHLELLQRDHPSLQNFEIIESEPHRDYRFRIIAPRAVVAKVMTRMVAELDYGNFKGACAASPDLDRTYGDALHDVWAVLRRLQK